MSDAQTPQIEQQPISNGADTPAPKRPENRTGTERSGRLSARSSVLDAVKELDTKYNGKADFSVRPSRQKAAAETKEAAPTLDKDGKDISATKPIKEAAPAKDPATGKFQKAPEKEETAVAAKEGEAEETQAAATEAKPKEGEKPVDTAPKIAAPATWDGASKVKWDKLPRPVQEQLVKDAQKLVQLEQFAAPLNAIIAPRATVLTAQYGSPAKALEQLFALSDYATKDPAGFVQYFARTRGIQLNQLGTRQPDPRQANAPQQQIDPATGQPVAAPQLDPALLQALAPVLQQVIGPLAQRIHGYEQRDQQRQQYEETQLHTQANNEVATMQANSAEFPYFNDLRMDMGRLMMAGLATTPKEAYEKAAAFNPAIKAQADAAAKEKSAADNAKKVADKQAAAVSVSGAPGTAVKQDIVPARKPGQSNRQSAREAVRRMADASGFMSNGQARV